MPLFTVDPWRCTLEDFNRRRITDLAALVEMLDATRSEPVLIAAAPGQSAHIARTALAIARHPDAGALVLNRLPTRRWLQECLLEALPDDGFRHAGALMSYGSYVISSRTVLSSVTRVEDPVPQLRQHVRSWFPGSWFEIDHDARTVTTHDPARWDLTDATLLSYRSAGMAEAAQRYAQRNDSVLTDYAVDVWNARVSVRVRSAETVPGTDQYVYSEATAELRLERGVCLRGGRVGVVIGGTCRTEPLPAPPPEPEPEPTETDDDDDEPEPEPTPEPPYELPSNLERTVVVETRLVAG